jgi:hypothetical protein
VTAELVNLRRERKRRARAVAGDAAAANRTAHGLTSAQKHLARATSALTERRLDGHRLTDEPAPRAEPPADPRG